MSPFKKAAVKEAVPKGRNMSLMLMTTHLKQKGLVLHKKDLIPTNSDPMLPFSLMRIISKMLHHY